LRSIVLTSLVLLLLGAAIGGTGWTLRASAVTQPTGDATPTVETAPVSHSGDAADDPAIWRDPADPSRSIVIGNDKLGALEVYDLSGARIQRLTGGFYGNVDTRTAFVTGTGTIDIAVAYRLGIRVYRIDPSSRQLVNVTDATSGSIPSPIGGEGICLYRSPVDGATYVFVNARDGRIAQLRLQDTDGDGSVEGAVVRQWDVGTEVEGCVADDELGALYISEENVAIWKYGAEPTAPTGTGSRVAVDRAIAAGGHIRPDAEGLTIVYQPGGTGYLIASSQAASDTLNSYLVYERQGSNAFIREFRVVTAPGVADGCGRTDGIDALAADLGPAFPNGIFVCQDNNNSAPGSSGNQNFKFVPLERVVGLSSEPPPNQDPTAVLDVSCAALSCHVDGTGSSDAEGPIASYAWDLGDGATSSEPIVDHSFGTAGTYTVSLVVTDGDGATDRAEQVVSVSDSGTSITFLGATTSNVNSTAHRVTVPANVQPGDGLLLFFATNTSAAIGEPTGVTGWQPLSTLSMSGATTRVWRKVAAAGDAGTVLQLSLASNAKGNLVLLAYRGTSGVDPISTFAASIDASGRSAHVTPTVSVSGANAWVVSYWTHKDSSTSLLSPPPGVVVRASGTQTGSGTVKGLVADSGAAVPAGPYGGLTATAGATATNATMWTIVLAAAG
jgi:myo-inositol-hexaphosphate 3-phosphohydrolase/PKD repeat protein